MKKGLLFFPLDVDFFSDEKLEFVSARFGAKGEVCTIRLLMRIYRDGYFIKWDEDAALMFSKSAGKDISPGLANGVVHELVKRGFFDKTLFDSFGVLTSHGIQVRYLNGCKRKKKVEINRDFLLVNPSEYKNLQVVCSSQHFYRNVYAASTFLVKTLTFHRKMSTSRNKLNKTILNKTIQHTYARQKRNRPRFPPACRRSA